MNDDQKNTYQSGEKVLVYKYSLVFIWQVDVFQCQLADPLRSIPRQISKLKRISQVKYPVEPDIYCIRNCSQWE